jgi:hypothetical protein
LVISKCASPTFTGSWIPGINVGEDVRVAEDVGVCVPVRLGVAVSAGGVAAAVGGGERNASPLQARAAARQAVQTGIIPRLRMKSLPFSFRKRRASCVKEFALPFAFSPGKIISRRITVFPPVRRRNGSAAGRNNRRNSRGGRTARTVETRSADSIYNHGVQPEGRILSCLSRSPLRRIFNS